MKTGNGLEVKSTSAERETEIVNIINTYEILEAATDASAKAPKGSAEASQFGARYEAQWTYYNANYAILHKLGDPL
jgi:hypothetical protein